MLTRKSLLALGAALLCLGLVGRAQAQGGNSQTPPGPPRSSAATNPSTSRSPAYNGHSALGANTRQTPGTGGQTSTGPTPPTAPRARAIIRSKSNITNN